MSKALITRKLKTIKLAGLLACSIFDAFPSKKGQWLAEIKDIRGAYSSGVCSGFSPDSLFTHNLKNRDTSTKFDANV